MTALLEAALAYAARGWPVFPCKPGQKVPATAHGVLDATTSEEQIRAWWQAMPDANIGIATGTPGPDVIDVDVKPDGNGWEAFGELTEAHLTDGSAAYVSTPSGGMHAYYTGTTQRNGRIPGRHIDYRATGGYVIAPPSTVAGRPYTHRSRLNGAGQPADWAAIRAHLDPPPDPAPFRQPARDEPALPPGGRPGDDWAARTTWAQLLEPHGWARTRDLGNGRAMWRRPGKTDGSSATTRDDGGLYVFSTSTEFEPEVPYSKFGALAVLEHGGDHSAAAAALRLAGYGEPAATFTQAGPPPSTSQSLSGMLPDFDLGALAEAGISEPQRLAGGMLYRASVHCLAGVPGGGKTTLMAWWMLQHIRDGGHIMLLDEESGPEQAAEKFLDLGATPDELRPPRFTYVPFPARGWNTTDLAQLHALITERDPGIIGWDSVAAFLAIAGADENSASDVTAFWQKVLVPCARRFGAAVIGVDHITKNGDSGGYSRGSGAKKAASDVQYMMETIKPFNRQQDGVLRLTTAPGKDRRGWLATAYQIHVKTGEPVTLEIIEAAEQITSGRIEMKPGKAKLWEALQAIATEARPASAGQLVDWIARKHGHGLKRQTVSTYLNELAADGLAQPVSVKPGLPKFWYPLITDSYNSRSNPSGDTPLKSVSSSNGQRHAADQGVSAVQGQFQPTRNPSPDASCVTRQVVSAPLIGADNPADTLTPPATDAPGVCTGCGESQHPTRSCFATGVTP